MNAFHEYALLFAIAVPLLAIIGLNLFLHIGGERGAGLLPSSRPFPVEDMDATVPAPALPALPAAPTTAAANDETERQAA